jgi:hypothetical protein
LEVGITGHNFERGPSKDHSTKVWLQLVQWFLRRRLKCEMLTDGRKVMTIAKKKKRNSNKKVEPRCVKVEFHISWVFKFVRRYIKLTNTVVPLHYDNYRSGLIRGVL